ncbi:hypothetical protein [Parasphingorhabdus sp.]|uniref:hypothetical protein n=1 Tax=Parasphingorhabdus sp. TaxID=2709688 RepID=UPI002F944772
MRFLTPIMISVIIATGGCVHTGADADVMSSKDDKYIITEIGEPINCIMSSNIRSTEVIDNQTIDFKMNNGDIYRNNLPNKCPGLTFEQSFSYRTSINQLCNVDIIKPLDSTAGRLETRGACGLGKFQKIEKIKRTEAED